MKIHIVEIIDTLKSNWCLWSAYTEDARGNRAEGSVQASADGELIADETFEKDE